VRSYSELTPPGWTGNLGTSVSAITGSEVRGSGDVGTAAAVPLAALQFLGVGLVTGVLAPTAVGVALVDQCAAFHVARVWARAILALYGVSVRTRRLAALDPQAPYVIMSNHRSQFDILAVVAGLGEHQLRWVAKKELTRVPVFGWALEHTGHIIIDRSDPQQAIASLRAARTQMERGISVVLFPEGTRSEAGQLLLPLKKGGFMLALETGFPIVPVVVRGSREILPRGSWRATPGEIEVVVGAPIPVAGATREQLMADVRDFMVTHLRAGSPRSS
jgi:1-acyl-sn-glycerol-3-phosphate acyltransferase